MVEIDGGAVFWSYAHEDDQLDSGLIVALARRLSAEFSLITGKTLRLFIDRDILWGEEWRRRIDGALTETTFFVPILTPRYFTRAECRTEATVFYGNARALEANELLLPILYAPVPEFSATNSDELIAILSQYQHVDWTNLRLLGADSADYRRAVHALAVRLVDASERVAERQLQREMADVGNDSSAQLGLADVASAMAPLLPAWREAMESAYILRGQFQVVWEAYGPRLTALERSGTGQMSAKLAILQRLAKEQLPLAERYLANSREYVRIAIELEPFVTQALRASDGNVENIAIFEQLWSTLDSAAQILAENEAGISAGGVTAGHWARSRAHLSRLVRQVADTYETGESIVTQTNDNVRLWLRDRDRILSQANE